MIERHLTSALPAALADTPVVLLNGARQSGKSTLVRSAALRQWGGRYLSLDDATLFAAAKRDPAGFLAGLSGSLVLDEIQRVPELFPAIKVEVDRDRRAGRFLLTGSANVLLLPRLAESLADRMEVLTLWPFTQGELAGHQEHLVDQLFGDSQPELPPLDPQGGDARPAIIRRVLAGGYPEVQTRANPARRKAWFGSYLTTLMQKEVRDLSVIEDLATLPRLLSLLAARAGSLLNQAELARSLGLPQTTLKRYLPLLQATFLVQPLPAWSGNLGKRLIQAPKMFLADTGLLAHLLGLTPERLAEDAGAFGPVLENFVMMELRKQAAWSRCQPQFFHWRTANNQEVDLVLEDAAGRLVGIEVKASATLGGRDWNGLKALAEAAGKRFHRGVILYTGSEVVPFGARLHALPVAALWRM